MARKAIFAVSTLVLGASAAFAPVPATATAPPASPTCAVSLDEPMRAKRAAVELPARAEEALASHVEARIAGSGESFEEAAADSTLWVDECGAPFFKEPALTEATMPPPATSSAAPYPLADTFRLASRPGAKKTIYLDFRGATVTNTAWNESYGASFVAPPFSIDSDPAFSAAEQERIQKAYAKVAEDYAPFDVNVTTAVPAPSALKKDFLGDPTYGLRTLITNGDPIGAECNCGGIAYIGVSKFNEPSFSYYSPAFVFADQLGYSGESIGEAASHEIGHNLGLDHDGHGTNGYYAGEAPWAPIMGVGYYHPLTQWSKGEYVGANNSQDDLSLISNSFAYLPDDASSAGGGLTQLQDLSEAGAVASSGLISGASDRDAFTFQGAGETTLTVAPDSLYPNLDITVRVYDSAGQELAAASPTTTRLSSSAAAGLDVNITLSLPADVQTYTVVVEGSGQGTVPSSGAYSTYGSTGPYRVEFMTSPAANTQEPPAPPEDPMPPENPTPEVAPVSQTTRTVPALQTGRAYQVQLQATGGDGAYRWSAVNLPAGLTVSPSGLLSGTPTRAGVTWVAVRVESGPTADPVFEDRGLTLTVVEPLRFTTGATLPKAKKGKYYARSLAIAGGLKGYTWARKGTLPRGLTVKLPSAGAPATQAKLVGTPKATGTYRFTLTAKDKRGVSVKRTFTVRVVR